MVGTLASTDSVFQNTGRNTSAHYGVGQSDVHQYVDEGNTAFHAGNWLENLQSIGIEHEDFGSDHFTDALYANSASLIRDICARYGLPINRDTIRPHNQFTATACPGALDIDRLIREANNQSNQGNNQVTVLDLARARVLAWGILGRNGYDGHSNALNGEADGDLNSYHVGKEAYDEIWDFFNSEEGKDWITNRLPAVYRRVTDLTTQTQGQQRVIEQQAVELAKLKVQQPTQPGPTPVSTIPSVVPPTVSTDTNKPSEAPVNTANGNKEAEPVKEGAKDATRVAVLGVISYGISYALEQVVPGLPKNEVTVGLTLVLRFIDGYIHHSPGTNAKGLLPF